MLYAIIAEDVDNSQEKRRETRVAHLQRLHVLNQQGRLLLAGAHLHEDDQSAQTYTGSLIVAEFDSLEEAKKWADADPYIQAGVYANVSIKPFLKVLP